MPEKTLRYGKIRRIMMGVWSSLDSHLEELCLPTKKIPKRLKKRFGGEKWDKKCVKDYAEMINLLADLL